jgi:hypothetical protein
VPSLCLLLPPPVSRATAPPAMSYHLMPDLLLHVSTSPVAKPGAITVMSHQASSFVARTSPWAAASGRGAAPPPCTPVIGFPLPTASVVAPRCQRSSPATNWHCHMLPELATGAALLYNPRTGLLDGLHDIAPLASLHLGMLSRRAIADESPTAPTPKSDTPSHRRAPSRFPHRPLPPAHRI